MAAAENKKIIGVCSGGFDPIHSGHINLINESKKHCDYLIVLVNNDVWLRNKKGYNFFNEEERIYILENIKDVDEVILTNHKDGSDLSVCRELECIKPDIFFNGGDRKEDNIPEYDLCVKLGIKMVFGVGGEKSNSSSELVRKAAKSL